MNTSGNKEKRCWNKTHKNDIQWINDGDRRCVENL